MNYHRATIWVADLVENLIEDGSFKFEPSTFADELKWVLPGIDYVDGHWLID